ncbi:MAG: 2-oxo acid dehydrogenase subunit E2 [Rubrivivax sp.]|nr:2-oxo acid dehydrogenase subunit E2 [Rubrivivax sp.]
MSTHTIKVPDVGEGIAEVELVVWHVKPGDVVAEDQSLADVMTDKASVEIPSPVAGRVQSLGGEVGQMLAVGGVLIMIETDADAVSTAAAPPAAAAPAAAPIVTPATAAPHARVAPVASTLPAPAAAAVDRPIASPAVRRRAWELGVDLNDVKASGTAGRIRLADLDAAPRSAVPAAAFDERPQLEAPTDSVETIRVLGLRRRIAMQMQESKRRIPHFSYVEELDVTEAEALRAALNARWAKTRGHLTLLPLLMRAMVLAVRDFPQINARFDDDTGVITRHQAVHLGVATQTENGLMVPVVMQAQTLDLWGLAAAVARLADAARAGRATRAELSGSTLTISSLGALGGIVSTPVINRPEVAIVAVNRIVEKPVVRGGHIVVRQTMNLSSSFDHRVVDGADAARYVQALRALMETPALLFVG